MKDTECPYCGKLQEICHDDGYGYDEGDHYNQECGDCGKTFLYETKLSIDHETFQAPCLNGEPHDFRPIQGHPELLFLGKFRCSYCKEEKIDLEEVNKNYKKYFDELNKGKL